MTSLRTLEPLSSGGIRTKICLQFSLTVQTSASRGVTPRAPSRWCLLWLLPLCPAWILQAQRPGLKEACAPH